MKVKSKCKCKYKCKCKSNEKFECNSLTKEPCFTGRWFWAEFMHQSNRCIIIIYKCKCSESFECNSLTKEPCFTGKWFWDEFLHQWNKYIPDNNLFPSSLATNRPVSPISINVNEEEHRAVKRKYTVNSKKRPCSIKLSCWV